MFKTETLLYIKLLIPHIYIYVNAYALRVYMAHLKALLKQISEEEKPFTSPLNIYPEACRKGWGERIGNIASSPNRHPISSWPVDI